MSLEQRLKKFSSDLLRLKLVTLHKPTESSLFHRLVVKRRTIEFIMSTLLVFGGQQFLNLYTFFSPIWPATGVALSAIFLRGQFVLTGVFMGSFLSNLINHVPLDITLGYSALFTLYIMLTYQIALRFIGPVTPIANIRVWFKFLLLVATSSGLYAFTLFSLYPILSASKSFNFIVFAAWLGNINGILCLTPLCLMFDPFIPQKYFSSQSKTWWVLSISIMACHILYFANLPIPPYTITLGFLVLLCFYAQYFGQIPTTSTLLGISTVYLTGVKSGVHLFAINNAIFDISLILILFTLSAILSISISTLKQEKYYKTCA